MPSNPDRALAYPAGKAGFRHNYSLPTSEDATPAGIAVALQQIARELKRSDGESERAKVKGAIRGLIQDTACYLNFISARFLKEATQQRMHAAAKSPLPPSPAREPTFSLGSEGSMHENSAHAEEVDDLFLDATGEGNQQQLAGSTHLSTVPVNASQARSTEEHFRTIHEKLDQLLGNQAAHKKDLEKMKSVKQMPARKPEPSEGRVVFGPKNAKTSVSTTPTYAAIITANSPTVDANGIEVQLQNERTFSKLRFTADSVAKVGNKLLRLTFKDASKRDKLVDKVNASDGLTAVKGSKRNPLVLIAGIRTSFTKEEALECIKQNSHLSELALRDEEIHLCYATKGRKEHLFNIVLRVSPRVHAAIMNKKHVDIDMFQVRALNLSPYTQCFKCLQFGHIESRCKKEWQACAKCASTEHRTRDCTRAPTESKKCYNCTQNNIKFGEDKAVTHAANDQSKCAVIKRVKERLHATIDYGL